MQLMDFLCNINNADFAKKYPVAKCRQLKVIVPLAIDSGARFHYSLVNTWNEAAEDRFHVLMVI